MMLRQSGIALLLAALALPAAAQGIDPDRRIEVQAWHDGTPIPLRAGLGVIQTVLFIPGETVTSVEVEDPAALQISVAPGGDSLTLKPVTPVRAVAMNVRTNARSYNFSVAIGDGAAVPYVVRLAPPITYIPAPPGMSPVPTAGTPYRLKGDKALRPVKVVDDGKKTFIEWLADQPIPAMFARTNGKDEETVDTYMRGGVQVIDRVYDHLVFRYGKRVAEARRQSRPGTKGAR